MRALGLPAALVGLAMLAGGCSLAGRIATAPHPARVGAAPDALQAVNVWVPVPGADSLAGWWTSAPEGAPAVVLAHGVTDNRLRLVERGRALADAGYAVLMVDLPGHGESPGRVGFGWPERRAVAAAVAFVRDRRPGTRVGVLGISLGGAAAVFAGRQLDADALVLEMVYPTIDAAVRNRMNRFAGAFGPLVSGALLGQAEALVGVPPDSLRPVEAIRQLDAPVFVISGRRDPFTPPREARALYDAAPGLKAFWLVEGGRHEDLYAVHPDRYRRRVVDFFEATLGVPPSR